MKVKDLTLGQIKEICDKQERCAGLMTERACPVYDVCPIFDVCRNHCKETWAWKSEQMEREIKPND